VDKDVAQAMIRLALSMDDTIVKMEAQASRIDDIALREQFNRAIGDLMGRIACEIIFPIQKLFPDLGE
jgi:hypothetical protein